MEDEYVNTDIHGYFNRDIGYSYPLFGIYIYKIDRDFSGSWVMSGLRLVWAVYEGFGSNGETTHTEVSMDGEKGTATENQVFTMNHKAFF